MNGFFGVIRLGLSGQEALLSLVPDWLETNQHTISGTQYVLKGFRTENLALLPEYGLSLVGWARIDNRRELVAKLALAGAENDLTIILAAYQKWGTDCLKQLIGDFSFVLVDENSQTFLLAKDPLGVRPLFYTRYDDLLFLSTRVTDLREALPTSPEINLTYVARELKNFPQPVEETFFRSIHRLKPGHFLKLSPQDTLVEQPYWELTRIPLPGCKTKADYHALLLACLEEAIRCRIQGKSKVGCQLSGGMDSSAIAVLLSRLMPIGDIHTYSFVLDEKTRTYSPNGIDEQATQADIIQFAGLDINNHHPITRFHFNDIYEELDTRNDVMGGLANSDAIWQDSLFKEAAERDGVEVMFSGFPGDEGISAPGSNYFHEYLSQGNITGLMQHLAAFGLTGLKGIIRYYVGMYRGSTNASFQSTLESRNLLHPSSPLHAQLQENSFPFDRSFSAYLKRRMCRPHTTLRTESEGAYANRHGMETVYPLADIRLLQLVYSLPVHLFKPKPYKRALFRNLTKGILPENVRLQPKFNGAKTLAFADYWITNKSEQLADYVPKDRYSLYIDLFDVSEPGADSKFMETKRRTFLKEVDYLLEKNTPPQLSPL
ncbi:asparagine synthetase B family protein [Lunatimonas salinarum]|uniref:asparagine synthetase B family protein n=1 Tax=Lunatimonas salinarum TaxID=1774590 RepID=UPI001ADFC6A9|nr:asparagine synthase-related protein [Lunatimonas salinarum]